MAAAATQNPVVKTDSKSAKKKKAAKTNSAEVEAPAPVAEVSPTNGTTDNANEDGSYESPYIKELYKSIRNVNKKITNASRVDSIVAENSDKSLDELVSSRKINADQKTQLLKKPALMASLSQLEEQIAQYKKFDQEYKVKLQSEKSEFEKTHTERSSKKLEEAVNSAKSQAAEAAVKQQQDDLLLISQFLKLAAIRRSEVGVSELEESKALEGLLAQVYAGDASAVAAMLNLIQGSSETISSIAGEQLTVTYADLKTASLAQIQAVAPESDQVETTEYPVESDPTIANAGLTELDAPAATELVDGQTEAAYDQGVPANSGFGDGAANAAAEANWDNNNELSASQEWVEVPRDAAETDTGVTATPAAPSNTQSWADDQPDSPTQPISTPPVNDGFQAVERNRDRGGRGSFNRGRGDGRGRGRGNFRGDGRGRGNFRGNGGAPRGGNRRSDESAS
ncbi:hypothetical protein WAI453_010528 [Rhynchosporium graminicola]|uniref:YAG7-like dimerisation domain-containing protein n=1 Tax=Rhynchosporium graminicola TaxID=2792576 RepID=A0A1E1JT78_9HELO|nr:uncharacterized protein RCO7_04576 [Rhynchosporium commune]